MGALKEEYLPYYTYSDYVQWEDEWELIEGIPYAMSPSPMFDHQSISMLIGTSLTDSIKSCKNCIVVSEMDYKIADDTIIRPDIALVCGQKDGAYIEKAPELIVEIVSKSSVLRDEKIKFTLYEAQKVRYYVLLYPKELKATIYKIENSKYKKLVDISKGDFIFDNTKCQAKIDFDFVFERFRE